MKKSISSIIPQILESYIKDYEPVLNPLYSEIKYKDDPEHKSGRLIFRNYNVFVEFIIYLTKELCGISQIKYDVNETLEEFMFNVDTQVLKDMSLAISWFIYTGE